MKKAINAGEPQEQVFAMMRQLGLFVPQSIKLAANLYGMSINDAKFAVHYSKTWADCLQANDELHEAAFEAAKQLGFEEVKQEAPLQNA